MFVQDLLDYFSNNQTSKLGVVYDNQIKGHIFEESHLHEEVDTLIPYQVLTYISEEAGQEMCVWSPDTDVLTMLLDVAL